MNLNSFRGLVLVVVIIVTGVSVAAQAHAGGGTAYSASDLLADLGGNYTSTSYYPNAQGFSQLQGTAVDEVHHRLFVTDNGNRRVMVFDLDASNNLTDRTADYVLGVADLRSSGGGATTQSAFMNLGLGLVYDGTNDRLFVGDSSNNRVLVFDTATITNGENAAYVLGQANFTASVATTTQSGINSPAGISYDSTNNRLFVGDSGNNRVLVFDTATITNGMNASFVLGQGSFTAATSTTSQSGMTGASGLAYDPTNSRLFVSNGNRVTVYNVASGTVSNGMNASFVLGQDNFTSSDSASAINANEITTPGGLVYDSANSRLFVSEYLDRIMVFNVASGTVSNGMNASFVLGQANFTTATTTIVSQNAMDGPSGLAYNSSNDYLFVPDLFNSRVVVFNVASGTIANGQNAVDVLGSIDGANTPYYVTSTVTNGEANNGPVNAYGLGKSLGVAMDSAHHRLFVADGANRVLVYNLDASDDLIDRIADYVLGQPNFKTNTATTTQSGLNYNNVAGGLSYDPTNDRLFVADYNNSRVMVFDTASITNGENAAYVLGQGTFTANSAATTASGLSSPTDVIYDSTNNRLFVNDYANERVVVFNMANIATGMDASYVIGQADFTNIVYGTSASEITYSTGVAYDSADNRLFMSDIDNSRVLVFNVASGTIANGQSASHVLGQSTTTTNTAGTSQSSMRYPRSLTFDSTNNHLFVSDNGNNRIMGFDVATSTIADGENAFVVLGQTSFGLNTSGTSQTTLFLATAFNDLTYDSLNNRLYVADARNNRVMIYDFGNIVNASLAPALVGASYSDVLTATSTQGDATYSLSAGALPSGLSLASDGTLSGTPAAGTNGTHNLTLQITDTLASAGLTSHNRSYAIVVFPSQSKALRPSGGGGGTNNPTVFASSTTPSTVTSTTPAPASTTPDTTSDTTLRAQIETLLAQIAVLRARLGLAPLPAQSAPSSGNPAFSRDLTVGASGADVKALQEFLNTHGFQLVPSTPEGVASTGPGAPGNETTLFGALTRAALARFQAANGISPAAGYFGPKTREYLAMYP